MEPGTGVGPRHGPFGRLRLVLQAILAVFLVSVLDPFGVDAAVEQASTELFSRVMGACYPDRRCWWPRRDIGQEKIAVVLYDDEYLEDPVEGHSWPPPLQYHARLLRALTAAGARAVFFDILFAWDRGAGEAEFAQAIEEARTGSADASGRGTQVVLAQVPPSHRRDQAMPGSEEVATARNWVLTRLAQEATRTAPISWAIENPGLMGMVYPCLAETAPGDLAPTPAVALYRLLPPDTRPETPPGAHCVGTGVEERAREDEHQQLLLVWGVPISARMAANGAWKDGCTNLRDATGPMDRLKDLARLLAQSVFVGLERRWPDRGRCPYLDTYSALDVLTDEKAREALNGRVVLVGVGYRASTDTVETPFGGRRPGVFLHATALDNLLTLGPRHTYTANRHVLLAVPLPFSGGAPFELTGEKALSWTAGVLVAFLFPPALALLSARSRHLGRTPLALLAGLQALALDGPPAGAAALARDLARWGRHLPDRTRAEGADRRAGARRAAGALLRLVALGLRGLAWLLRGLAGTVRGALGLAAPVLREAALLFALFVLFSLTLVPLFGAEVVSVTIMIIGAERIIETLKEEHHAAPEPHPAPLPAGRAGAAAGGGALAGRAGGGAAAGDPGLEARPGGAA